jgi:hypothetical protein
MAQKSQMESRQSNSYHSVDRGKAMYQLAYCMGGRRVAKQILGGLTNDAEAVEAMATPELESLVASRKVFASSYALHVVVEEHAQAVIKLGKATLRGLLPQGVAMTVTAP